MTVAHHLLNKYSEEANQTPKLNLPYAKAPLNSHSAGQLTVDANDARVLPSDLLSAALR